MISSDNKYGLNALKSTASTGIVMITANGKMQVKSVLKISG